MTWGWDWAVWSNIAVKSTTVEVDTSGKGSGLWLFDKLLLQTEDMNCYIYYPFLSFGDFPLVLAKTSLGAPKMRENYAWKNLNRRIFLKAPLGEKAYLPASWNRPATAGNIRNPLQNISFIGPPTYSIYIHVCLVWHLPISLQKHWAGVTGKAKQDGGEHLPKCSPAHKKKCEARFGRESVACKNVDSDEETKPLTQVLQVEQAS